MQHIFSLSTVLFVAGFVCFAAFSWGVKGHFRSTGKMPPGMKLTSALSLAGFTGFTFRLMSLKPAGGWAEALVLFALSLALFCWAIQSTRKTPPTLAFDDDKPSFLLRHGPYQYVRHPFYLAYMLFWTGTACACTGVLPWVTPLVMLTLYRHAAGKEEQKFAGSELAAAYAAYRAKAGMFFPRASLVLS
jgi:protein-S-isoprenylcysteine O-methyltransferase Ste14